MDLKDIKKIGIIGAGTMGSGIAQVFAEAGFYVYLFDETYKKAEEGKRKVIKRLQKALEKQCDKNGYANITTISNMQSILLNIVPIELRDMKSINEIPQLFIEALFEDLKTKQTVFRELDDLCDPQTILATNTSSISISEIAKAVSDARKEKIIGAHFMNPPYILKLLEIVRSDCTSDETYKLIFELAQKLKRDPILTSMDVPGFIVNANLMPSLRQSLICLENNIASIEDINRSIMLGVGGAMGPLDLGDLIGWDIVLNILNQLYKYYGEYKPPQLLHHLVREGYLGKKTKKGIFDFYGKE